MYVRPRSCPVTPKMLHGISEFVAEFGTSSFDVLTLLASFLPSSLISMIIPSRENHKFIVDSLFRFNYRDV